MENSNSREKVIISVGGSLIVPPSGINIPFLKRLNTFIRTQLAKNPNRQFFLVIGGGSASRAYRDAGREVLSHELTDEDLDWLGIHATRMNAHLMRTIFQDLAYPSIIENYEFIRKTQDPIVIAAGWKPGWSTDFCAALLCEDYNVKTVINLSNVKQVYDKDPNEYPDAKPIDRMDWAEFRKLVGDDWTPGMHAPFDPVAAKKIQSLHARVVVLSGDDFDNVTNYFEGKPFLGTVIE